MITENNIQKVHSELIPAAIFYIRGLKVMLSTDLANLYEIEPKVLIQAIKRNIERFPEDFMFQLNNLESQNLKSQIETSNEKSPRSQIVTLNKRGKNQKYAPYAFTEQGVAMLSSVLRSPKAIEVNIEIMRTFVKLRKLLATNAQLAQKIEELEKKYDSKFKIVFDTFKEFMKEEDNSENEMAIGFNVN